jgi:molybdopterin synthase catalytic subunit
VRTFFEITPAPLDLAALAGRVTDASAGAVATFTGTTRNSFRGKAVLHLEYEAYPPLAERVLHDIGMELAARWPSITGVAIAHRVGRVEVGEPSVVIAVSAPHRGDALAACAHGIEQLKRTLPVWKKEVFRDGEVWRENVIEGGEPP